jgi:ferredoxin-type protein NapF
MVRLLFFVAACVFLWPVLPQTGALKFILQASPFAAICSSVSLRHAGIGAAAGLGFAAAAIYRRRWFCRYICPAGLLLEGAARIGAKTSWWTKCPPVGMYAALLTFFGAIAGYPVLLWMDPLAIFGGFFAIRTSGTILSGFFAGLGLGILLLLSLTSGLFWCARLCPLGGTQDILFHIKSLFKKTGGAAAAGLESRFRPMRRALFLGAAGICIGLLGRRTGAARGENAPLRPPGAVSEDVFTGLCTRCGNCARVCPSGIILPDSGQAGIWGLLAPVVSYEKKYCLEDCANCTNVCPSGALQRLDLEQKRRYIIGEALVDGSFCLATLGQKDCDACVAACPFGAVRIHWDEDLYVAYPLIEVDRCNGCGACEAACHVKGYKAIRVWKPEKPLSG